MSEVKFHRSSWSWESKDSDQIRVYEGVDGRPTLGQLIAHLAEVAPHAGLDDIGINYATVVWVRPATEEEVADRDRRQKAHEERHLKWERERYWILKAKFEDFCVCGRALPCRHVDAPDHGPGSYWDGRSTEDPA